VFEGCLRGVWGAFKDVRESHPRGLNFEQKEAKERRDDGLSSYFALFAAFCLKIESRPPERPSRPNQANFHDPISK